MKIHPTRRKINSHGGLGLAGSLLSRLRPGFDIDRRIGRRVRSTDIPAWDMLASLAGMMCMGRNAFDHISALRSDEAFRRQMGVARVPSEGALRQMLENHAEALLPLVEGLLVDSLRGAGLSADACGFTPVDIDVSCLDNSHSRKEGVGPTYRGYAGYSPIFAYAGTEGRAVGVELRPGVAHCQKGTPGFIRRVLGSLKTLGMDDWTAVFRMDAGNDAEDNRLALAEGRQFAVIAANLRGEDPVELAEVVMRAGRLVESGPERDTYDWESEVIDNGFRRIARVSFRHHAADGSRIMFPEPDISVWWTNLPLDTAACVGAYRRHGTSEQYHSELKSELGVERLPSGRLAVNAVVLAMAMVAFNILRRIGLDLGDAAPMRRKAERRRIKTVIRHVIMAGAALVSHANRVWTAIWEHEPWLPEILRIHELYSAA